MRVVNLNLTNFRNYEQLAAEFSAGLVLISGENGQGKTNLMESMYFLSHQESHRVFGSKDLILNGRDVAQVSASVFANNRQLLPAVALNRSTANTYFLNGNKLPRSSDAAGILRTVIFSPEDLQLVRGNPSDRRAFLDSNLVQTSSKIAQLKANYDRVLKQRNTLLKSARINGMGDASTLEIWDEQLVTLGAQLVELRVELVAKIQPLLQKLYRQLSGSDSAIRLEVKSSIFGWSEEDDEQAAEEIDAGRIVAQFADVIRNSRKQEIDRGITLFGPHRDDLKITLDSQSAKHQASQGEAWSIALGLKLATAEIFRHIDLTGDPVLLLDDVFAVLDQGRRERLMSIVSGFEQVIVTSTFEQDFQGIEWSQKLNVAAGRIEERA